MKKIKVEKIMKIVFFIVLFILTVVKIIKDTINFSDGDIEAIIFPLMTSFEILIVVFCAQLFSIGKIKKALIIFIRIHTNLFSPYSFFKLYAINYFIFSINR